eukprot:scaffold48_cov161-Amphora_coffeaeformis.AAC.5
MSQKWKALVSTAILFMASTAHVSGAWATRPTRREGTAEVVSRRQFAVGLLVIGGFPIPSPAAETVGKDEGCNDATCLGVWDGLLADCPHTRKFGGAACVSSQDDTPGVFAEPWDYAELSSLNWKEQMRRLESALSTVTQRRGDEVRVLIKEGRYVRVIFTDARSRERSVGEFYFTPNDTTVQFRLSSLTGGGGGAPFSQSLSNIERAEALRKELRYLKVPVLRNRKRAFFFAEADGLDTFGPGSASLGPPAEMKTGELEGRQEEDARLRIEPLQQFPFR